MLDEMNNRDPCGLIPAGEEALSPRLQQPQVVLRPSWVAA